MKLLKLWMRTLSIGATTFALAGITIAQGPGMGPMGAMGAMGPMGPMSGPMGGMGIDGVQQIGPMSYVSSGATTQFAGYTMMPEGDGAMPMPMPEESHGIFGGDYRGNDCNTIGESMNDPSLYCSRCGYAGCVNCGWGIGIFLKSKLGRGFGRILPYGEGGLGDQRLYDFYAGSMVLHRERAAGQFNFTSLGLGTNNFVLTSDDVDLDGYRWGLQLGAAIQMGPGTSVEVDYFGLNKWDESATATSSTPTLFSFISAFGTDPNNGFDDTDRSFIHTLTYSSTINNGEVNFRRRWVGPYKWFQGSYLVGVRLVDLDESATFSARGENNNGAANNGLRFFDYTARTRNTLTGFQVGSDLWLNLVPGIKIGVEGKSGVYGNKSQQNTAITANSITDYTEAVSDGRVAYVGQVTGAIVYRLTYSWTIRSTYQYIYIDNVALAVENFNSTPPVGFSGLGARTPRINNDAEIAYSGFSIGAEYTW